MAYSRLRHIWFGLINVLPIRDFILHLYRFITILFFLLPLFFGQICKADSNPEVQEIQLYTGETVEIQSGPVDRLLNLDFELVSVEIQEPDAILVKGLKYGTATVRVWTEEGLVILRVQVLGQRAVLPKMDEAARKQQPGIWIDQSIRNYQYKITGLGQRTSNITAHLFEGRLQTDHTHLHGLSWLEYRDRRIGIPKYILSIERTLSDRKGYILTTLGTAEVDWSRFTFMRDRFEGGKFQFGLGRKDRRTRQAPAGLELCYGRDIVDFVTLGSPYRMEITSDSWIGGGRIWWSPFKDVSTQIKIGSRWEPEGDYSNVAEIEIEDETGPLQYSGIGAYDGVRWAGEGKMQCQFGKTHLHVTGKYIQDLFRSLKSARSLPGSQYLLLNFHHYFTKWLNIKWSSGWRRYRYPTSLFQESNSPDTTVSQKTDDSWKNNRQHALGVKYRFGSRLSLNSWWRLGDDDYGDSHWNRQQTGIDLDFGRINNKPQFLQVRFLSGWAYNRNKVRGLLAGKYAWHSLRLHPQVSVSNWLNIDCLGEMQMATKETPDKPSPLLWQLRMDLRLPAVNKGKLVTVYRKWEHLSVSDGEFDTGRYLSFGVEFAHILWQPFAFDLRVSWDQDLDLHTERIFIQIGLTHNYSSSRAVSRIAKGNIRGRVFYDKNANGSFEDDEYGLPDIRLRLDNGQETETDKKGRYCFRGIKGIESYVRLVQPETDSVLSVTTSRVKMVSIANARRERINFGLGPAPAQLSVSAFQDLNTNGRHDPEEPLIGNIILSIKELDVHIRTTYREPIEHLLPPNRSLAPEWQIHSIPDGYRPIKQKRDTIRTRQGQIIPWELPLKAIRSVSGKVFYDSDGDGLRDTGEKLVKGAVIRAGQRFAVSDANGRYLLKELSAGPIEITLHTGPEGWTMPASVPLQLKNDPVRLENIDIGLQPTGGL